MYTFDHLFPYNIDLDKCIQSVRNHMRQMSSGHSDVNCGRVWKGSPMICKVVFFKKIFIYLFGCAGS